MYTHTRTRAHIHTQFGIIRETRRTFVGRTSVEAVSVRRWCARAMIVYGRDRRRWCCHLPAALLRPMPASPLPICPVHRRTVSITLHPLSFQWHDRVNTYGGNGSRVLWGGGCVRSPPTVSVRACICRRSPSARPTIRGRFVRVRRLNNRRHTLEDGRLITQKDRSRKSRRPILREAGTPSARAKEIPVGHSASR